MRRLLESRLASAALMLAIGIAAGMVPRPVAKLPPPSMEAMEHLPDLTREEVLAAWGEPDGMLSGFFGDIYQVNETDCVIVYYDSESLNAGTVDENTVPILYTVYDKA